MNLKFTPLIRVAPILVLWLAFWSCSKMDDFQIDEGLTDTVTFLQKEFYETEQKMEKLSQSTNKNFRQSLERDLRWDEAIAGSTGYFIPVKYMLPEGTVTDGGVDHLDIIACLKISRDPSSDSVKYELLNVFPDEDFDRFSGVMWVEDYFMGGVQYNYFKEGESMNRVEIAARKKQSSLESRELAAFGQDCITYRVGTTCVGDLNGGSAPDICVDRYETTCFFNGDMPPIDEETIDPWDLGGGGGGGGGDSNKNGDKEPKVEIRNNINDPCVDKLVSRIGTSGTAIAKSLNNVFGGKQTNVNMTFYSKPAAEMGNYAAFIEAGNLITDAKIYISDEVIAHASQEYLIATIYHEAWHGYLEMEKWKLGDNAFAQKYPTIKTFDTPGGDKYTFEQYAKHNQFSSFIEMIQTELKNFNPNLPDDVAEALAIDGLFTDLSNDVKILNDNERDTRKNKSKGTKCE